MPVQPRTVEQRIARIASRRHGVVARTQLLAPGVRRSEIEERLHSGALIPVHRGVYRVGHRAPCDEATYMAAVLACGDGALLAGAAAAHLFGLTKTSPAVVEVITRGERRVPGVATHRSRSFDARDATTYQGIPVTTVPRTIVDLAASMSETDLVRACHEARVLFGTTPARVENCLGRKPNATGARTLRRVLHGDVELTLSGLERTFRRLLVDAGLPLPKMNRVAGSHYVDCRWPEHGLTVELDSYRFHASRHAWERDRRREREARARGDDFRRFTYDDVFERPAQVMSELGAFFALRGRRRSSPARR